MAAYVWPAWLSWAVLVLVDAYVTVNPRAEIARLDLWALQSLATTFAVYAVSVVFLGWWMRRGGRWDGQGSMLNLLAAVDVAELLPGTLDKSGLPTWLSLLVWLYPLIAGTRALTGVSRASVGYCLAGMLLLSVPAVAIRVAAQWLSGLAG